MLANLSHKVTTTHPIRDCSRSNLQPAVSGNKYKPNCWNFDFFTLEKYLPVENLKLLVQHLPLIKWEGFIYDH